MKRREETRKVNKNKIDLRYLRGNDASAVHFVVVSMSLGILHLGVIYPTSYIFSLLNVFDN